MKKTIVLVALAAGASIAAGVWYARHSATEMPAASQEAPHKHRLEQRADEQGKVYYTCPMHPQVKQDEPGNCPICGMKLVKREEPAANGGAVPSGGSVVQIDARIVQNLGVRTAPVERGAFAQETSAVGAVEVDERRIFAVESRAAGWVEELFVGAVGDPVTRGQRVAGVYSPDLFAAQEELVLAVRSGDASLIKATRQRLILLGAAEAQVDEVVRTGKAQRRLVIAAPSNGVVTELNVRQGQQVSPGTPLMRIADLSQVWITVEIPEAQTGAVRKAQRAEARLSAMPGRVFKGRVDYLYPQLDVATRTLRARLVFDNPGGLLKPGMYADIALAGAARNDALLVPTEAVIRTGTRTVVLIAEGEGRFRPVEVQLGSEHSDRIVVLKGLEEGQQVVVSGQFLIDSEASLQGAYERLEGGQ